MTAPVASGLFKPPTRVEYIDSDPVILRYVVGKPPTIVGRVSVRNIGNNPHESLSFSVFNVRVDSMPRDGITARVSTFPLEQMVPTTAEIVLTLPPECEYREAKFHMIPLTSLERPTGCFALSGYIAADNIPTIKVPKAPEDAVREQKLMSWSASMPNAQGVQGQLLTGSLFWALASVSAAVIVSWIIGVKPWHMLDGSPKWDFSKSWASNTTLVATFLSALLGLTTLSPVLLPKPAYTFLDLWAAALLAIGPMLYLAFPGNRCPAVWLFISSAFVLWAAFTQLRMVRMLVAEVTINKWISGRIEEIVAGTLGALSCLLFAYGIASLVTVASQQKPAAGKARPATQWPLL